MCAFCYPEPTYYLLFVVLGMYIPVVLSLISLIGASIITSNIDIAIFLLTQKSVETISRREFAGIPLFILMGLLVSVLDIARETFSVANFIFRKISGGLCINRGRQHCFGRRVHQGYRALNDPLWLSPGAGRGHRRGQFGPRDAHPAQHLVDRLIVVEIGLFTP